VVSGVGSVCRPAGVGAGLEGDTALASGHSDGGGGDCPRRRSDSRPRHNKGAIVRNGSPR